MTPKSRKTNKSDYGDQILEFLVRFQMPAMTEIRAALVALIFALSISSKAIFVKKSNFHPVTAERLQNLW